MADRRRILAVDPGTVRIGLAISDPERRLASPLAVYRRQDAERDAAFFRRLMEQEEVGLVVVGLPLRTDGREGVQARAARQFGDLLRAWTGVPVTYFDERFTTRFAESELWKAGLTHEQRKQRRDKVAAQLLLQSYLEAGCPA
ncbi:MAG: Holliday junction resolvase RuvX [Gemmataceae bacterium]|nr:Holliday junction resolvase RuvX [Gemmataceae bacterium]